MDNGQFEYEYDRSFCEDLAKNLRRRDCRDAEEDEEVEVHQSPLPRKRISVLKSDEFKADEIDVDGTREKLRNLTASFLDSCDVVQRRLKTSDKKTMQQVDEFLGLRTPEPVPQYDDNLSPLQRHMESLCENGDDDSVRSGHKRNASREPPRGRPVIRNVVNCEECGSDYSSGKGGRSQKVEETYSFGSKPQSDAVRQRRQEIENRLDGIMTFELPGSGEFKGMRDKLTGMNEKMAKHRVMLDRYSCLDLDHTPSVEQKINEKYRSIITRIPSYEQSETKPYYKSDIESDIYYHSPNTTNGYGGSLTEPTGGQTAELRGRIRRLLCRSKNNPHYYRY